MSAKSDPAVAAREKARREQVRADRLKAALKGNMARRKGQARDKARGADDNAPEQT